MENMYAYHVVTERPMYLGQHIVFDEEHHSGVYERVMARLPEVEDIYAHPENYAGVELDHHLDVALRELAMEEVRKESYPDYPSRMGCLYVSETLEEAERWAEYFISLGRPTFQIVKIRVEGTFFAGDATKCFDGTISREENRRLADRYWRNEENPPEEPPIKELLAGGDLEVVEILRVFE